MIDIYSETVKTVFNYLNPIQYGLFWGAWVGGGGGGEVPAAHSSKTIHGIEMKFGWVVEYRKLINLV